MLEDGGLAEDLLEVTGLGEDEREVLAMHYGEGLSVPEIAVATGRSVNHAQARVYRALRKLRVALDDE